MDERVVLDASALIAFYRGEPGGDSVARSGAPVISAVNVVEVVEAAIRRGISSGRDRFEIERLGIEIASFTAEQAEAAGLLRESTREAGLSLADRACLALAAELEAPALTADKAWTKIDVGVEVLLIR